MLIQDWRREGQQTFNESGRLVAGECSGKIMLYSTKEAARFLSVSHRTLEDWRLRGGGPRFMRLGARVRYKLEDIELFLARPTFANTAEARAA